MSEHTDQYLYQGDRVTVIDRYDGIWIHKKGEQVGRGFPQFYEPLNMAPVIPFPPSGQVLDNPPEPKVTLGNGGDEKKEVEFSINSATKTEIANKLTGVGKIFATRIFERKPEGGYKSWEELIELNSDLSVNWETVKGDNDPGVVFT